MISVIRAALLLLFAFAVFAFTEGAATLAWLDLVGTSCEWTKPIFHSSAPPPKSNATDDVTVEPTQDLQIPKN